MDPHLVAAVCVHGELGLGRGARRGQDVGRLVGLHLLVPVGLSVATSEEVLPRDVPTGRHRAVDAGAPQHDHVLDGVSPQGRGGVDDRLQVDFVAPPEGDVAGEHQARPAGFDTAGERAGPEAGEDDRVDGADAQRRQHEGDRLGARGHVDGDAVALADAHPAQRGREARHHVQELRVGEHGTDATFVGIGERGAASVTHRHLMVDGVVGHVGAPAREPTERGRLVLEHRVPRAEPRQLRRCLGPEGIRLLGGPRPPPLHHRVQEAHEREATPLVESRPRRGVRALPPSGGRN